MVMFEEALSLHNRGDLAGARRLYSEILQQQPAHIPSLMNLAAICFGMSEYALAADLYSVILKLDATLPDVWFNRGCCYQTLGQAIEAENDYLECLALDDGKMVCLENLIAVRLGRRASPESLIPLVDRRLHHRRDLDFLLVLARLKAEAGARQEADKLYREALAISPGHPVPLYYDAIERIKSGQVEEGMPGLNNRWSIPGFTSTNPPRPLPLRKWEGENLENRTLYVAAEQGIGDMVRFSASIPSLQEQAVHLFIECDPRLVDLYRRSFRNATIVPAPATATELPEIDWAAADCFCWSADLPENHIRTRCPPEKAAWLTTDPNIRDQWKTWLTRFDGLRIGISWAGGAGPHQQAKHSLSLAQMLDAFQGARASLISLQYDVDRAEFEAANRDTTTPVHLPPGLDCRNDLDSLFALIDNLDLVVSVDNCTVCFAAALGKPVWAMLPANHDWRWDTFGGPARWELSVTRFCQDEYSGWPELLTDIRRKLDTYIPPRNPDPISPLRAECPPAAEVTGHPSCRARLLLINDSLNWAGWGHACSALGIHQALLRKEYRLQSYPRYSLATSPFQPSLQQFDSTETLSRFVDRYPQLTEAITANDIILVDSEGDATGSLYIAWLAGEAFGKEVRLINHSFLDYSETEKNGHDHETLRRICSAINLIVNRDRLSQQVSDEWCLDAVIGTNGLPLAIRHHFPEFSLSRTTDRGSPDDRSVRKITLGCEDGTLLSPETWLHIVNRLSPDQAEFRILTGARAHASGSHIKLLEKLHRETAGRVRAVYCSSEARWLHEIATSHLLVTADACEAAAAVCLGTPVICTTHREVLPVLPLPASGDCPDPNDQDPAEQVMLALHNPAKWFPLPEQAENLYALSTRTLIDL